MYLEFDKFLSSGSGQDVMVVNSKGSCSHNFVMAHLLTSATKKGKKVHLICCGESYTFFKLVCGRAGVLLHQLKERKLLEVTCLENQWRSEAAAGTELTVPQFQTDDQAQVVIIDDLLPLLDLSSRYDVIRQVLHLKAQLKPLLAVGLRTDDPEAELVSKMLKTMSNLWVDIYPLSTGYSRDVHGVIELSNVNPIKGSSRQRMHFKTYERGAKLFAIGSHIAIS